MQSLSGWLQRVAGAVTRRPLAVLAAVGLLAVVGAGLATGLRPSAGTDTLVDRDSRTFEATERYREAFGDDAIVVLVREDLSQLMLSRDLGRLLALEGCISGNLPPGQPPPGGAGSPCAKLAADKPVRVVYGPGTFVHQAAQEISREFMAKQRAEAEREKRAGETARRLARERGLSRAEGEDLARQAQELVRSEFLRNTLRLALSYGIRAVPRIDDPSFVSQLVFDPGRGANTPKARFAYILPNSGSALVSVRLRPELDDAQRARAIELIRAATRMPQYRLQFGGTYTVTGAPVVVSDLAGSISRAIVVLLVVALVVMALTLMLVFRSRPRLLPLALAMAATAILFGAMALLGASLTMASIAVLPILVGLGVDYAIQLQARFDEAQARGLDPSQAAVHAAGQGGPMIATACGATAAGFLVLALSPVPMVRGFGLLLVVGVLLAFACALTAGFAALARVHGGASTRRPPAALASAGRGARELLAALVRAPMRLLARLAPRHALGPPRRLARAARARAQHVWRQALAQAFVRPGRVLGVAVALALLGFALDTQTRVVSDLPKLVPSDLPAVRDLDTLQKRTGVAGQIDVLVTARDLTDPRVIAWMTRYQQDLLRRFGYRDRSDQTVQGCGKAVLCPALSLPSLFREGARTREDIRRLLDAVPPYFSSAVVSPDRRMATMSFGIKLMPLDRQHAVTEEMRERLNPPPGVQADLVGLPVLAAEANAKVSSDVRRMLGVVLSLVVVGLVLLAVLRRPERALLPLIPIALAAGWSALALFAVRIPLNPMSVTLGALVIAIATEFSVLLAERYRQERALGQDPAVALARTYASTGRAVVASGVTAIAGFAVLLVSDIPMLRDFGAVTVIDLSVALLGVMVVLPAVLILDERGELARAPRTALEWLRERAGRLARGARRPRLPRRLRGRLPRLRGRLPRLRGRLPRPRLRRQPAGR